MQPDVLLALQAAFPDTATHAEGSCGTVRVEYVVWTGTRLMLKMDAYTSRYRGPHQPGLAAYGSPGQARRAGGNLGLEFIVIKVSKRISRDESLRVVGHHFVFEVEGSYTGRQAVKPSTKDHHVLALEALKDSLALLEAGNS